MRGAVIGNVIFKIGYECIVLFIFCFRNCVIYCIGNNLCDEGAALTQTISYLVETIESNTIQQYRSLINISVNDNNGLSIPHTYYKIVENEAGNSKLIYA